MKLLKYFTILAAAAGIMSACTSDLEQVQTLPADQVVAPVLHDLESDEIVITPKTLINKFAMSWDAAYFGDKIVPSYSIEIAKADSDVWASIAVGITATEVELTYEQINLAAIDGLALPIEVAAATQIRIGATVGNSYQTFYSEAKALTVTPSSMEKTYNMIYMPGSYQGWAPADAATKFQVLYEFAGNGVFEGIADLGEPDEARQWKFTRDANWDFDWGIAKGETPEAEAKEVTLINNDGGDRDNINIYTAKRFYHFTMDTNTGLLKHNYSFNQIGVVGELNGWGGDEVMAFNAAKRRFYVDIENFSGEFKFRADAAWDMNWGGAAFGIEGDNLKVAEAGNYRVYLYLSNSAEMSYELNADMYGKEEPTGAQTPEEPEEPQPEENVYGLVGTHNEWGGTADTVLAAHNGDWVAAKGFELVADNQFKIRVNSDWAVNYGAEGEVEPFVLAAGETYTLVSGGKNMNLPAGAYDVYFNTVSFEFVALAAGSADPTLPSDAKAVKFYADVTATGWTNCNIYGWGDLGDYGGAWPGTALTTESVDGKEYYTFSFDVEAFGKTVNVIFNNGAEQTLDITNVVLDKDYIFTLTEKDGAGKWVVTLNGEAPAPKPEDPANDTWGLMGDFEGNNWSNEIALVAEGGLYVAQDVVFANANNEGLVFKVRKNGSWDTSYGVAGTAAFELGAAIALDGGNNVAINGEAGVKYDVYFDAAAMKIWVMADGQAPAVSATWGLMGDFEGNNWSNEIALVAEGGLYVAQDVVFANANNEGLVFKVRKNGSWDTSYGVAGTAAFELGAAIALDGGNNVAINGEAGAKYDFYFDATAMKIWVMADGQTPTI